MIYLQSYLGIQKFLTIILFLNFVFLYDNISRNNLKNMYILILAIQKALYKDAR